MATILIVEDEAHIMRVLSWWLARNGHEVLEAQDGAVALEVLERTPVDLLISDMNMPRMDGLGLIQRVREVLGKEFPIIVLSARCDQANLGERMAPYRVTLRAKPFVPSQLVADIEQLLETVAP